MITATLAALLLPSVSPAQSAPPAAVAPLPADQRAVRAHVAFLASDALKGREAGTADYDVAAEYVASQLASAGIAPGGKDGSYLQPVPMIGYRLADAGKAVIGIAGRADVTLGYGSDWTPWVNPAAAATHVSANVVFVGYGVVAPDKKWDDYRGVDVRGKIVAVAPGCPGTLDSEEAALFTSASTKALIAARHGAVGLVILGTRSSPASPPTPFGRQREFESWRDRDVAHSDAGSAPMLGTLTYAGASKLFATAPARWRAIVRQAKRRVARYRPEILPAVLTVDTRTAFLPRPSSSNVVGILPGSNRTVGREAVVVTAHLDHIGVDASGKGDRINNGALDNAVGIATVIEAAKRLAGGGARPKRTVIFVATTAEEKGLIGSSYFANNPVVPIGDIVANINIDMPILTYRFDDLVAFGSAHSTLRPAIAAAAKSIGVTIGPDPIPHEAGFVRSDQFNFVRLGVPSTMLWTGGQSGGLAAIEAFMSHCYHDTCDDLNQGIRWDQAARFVELNDRIIRAVADAPARPAWNPNDTFGAVFGHALP